MQSEKLILHNNSSSLCKYNCVRMYCQHKLKRNNLSYIRSYMSQLAVKWTIGGINFQASSNFIIKDSSEKRCESHGMALHALSASWGRNYVSASLNSLVHTVARRNKKEKLCSTRGADGSEKILEKGIARNFFLFFHIHTFSDTVIAVYC